MMRELMDKDPGLLVFYVVSAVLVVILIFGFVFVIDWSSTTDPVANMAQKMEQCLASEVFTREECITIITSERDGRSSTVVIPMPAPSNGR